MAETTQALQRMLAACCPAAQLPLCRPHWQVAKEDVDLIAQQCDLDKKKAERCLREAKGDLKAALRTLLSV